MINFYSVALYLLFGILFSLFFRYVGFPNLMHDHLKDKGCTGNNLYSAYYLCVNPFNRESIESLVEKYPPEDCPNRFLGRRKMNLLECAGKTLMWGPLFVICTVILIIGLPVLLLSTIVDQLRKIEI